MASFRHPSASLGIERRPLRRCKGRWMPQRLFPAWKTDPRLPSPDPIDA
jgi:hypothetical protein